PGAETVHRVAMAPADAGDLQRAVQRLNAAMPPTVSIANLWGGGATSFRLRPVADANAAQLVRLGDGLTGTGEITVTPAQSNVAFTDLHAWLAPQSTGAAALLRRFTRGNLLTTFVNGPDYFDELFVALRDAQATGCGFHLTGWSMRPQTKFVKRTFGDEPLATTNLAVATGLLGTDMIPRTLEQAASLIGAGGGNTRFLPA